MTAKEYLRQAYLLDLRIKSYIRELEELRSMSGRIRALSYDTDRVRTSPKNEAPFVHSIEKIMLMEDKIDKNIDKLVDLKQEINGKIDQVPDLHERMLLRYRYIENRTWEEIADEMNFCVRQIHRLHSAALQSFTKLFF